jgi:hypothetical protein
VETIWAQVPGGNSFPFGTLIKMGTYIYLFCKRCNEYIHIGKVHGSDFELPYDLMKRFLMKYSIRNGCTLTTVNDSIDDVEYRQVMKGLEFK